jgi:hypothetical protein
MTYRRRNLEMVLNKTEITCVEECNCNPQVDHQEKT